MGSKRSSKNPNKNARFSPTPAAPPADANHQNPKNSTTDTPSKYRKNPKLSAPIYSDSVILSLAHSTVDEASTKKSNSKGDKALEVSNEISHKDGSASRSSSQLWAESDILKLLKSVIALPAKGGCLITPENIAVLLEEIKDWAPRQLSEKNLNSKLGHLRSKFQKSPKPGPESSEFDRRFYELASKVWGSETLKAKDNATGGVMEQDKMKRKGNATIEREKVSKKLKGEKKKVDDEKEDEDVVEEEERDVENDEGTKEKAQKNMALDNGAGQEKDELLVDGDNGLLDVKGAGHSYEYLRHALEEYWTQSKLNMDTLYAALPNMNPVEAKHLDEKLHELSVRMLKLKMEKNKLSNEIIGAALGY